VLGCKVRVTQPGGGEIRVHINIPPTIHYKKGTVRKWLVKSFGNSFQAQYSSSSYSQ
jgi:hypothetical protein